MVVRRTFSPGPNGTFDLSVPLSSSSPSPSPSPPPQSIRAAAASAASNNGRRSSTDAAVPSPPVVVVAPSPTPTTPSMTTAATSVVRSFTERSASVRSTSSNSKSNNNNSSSARGNDSNSNNNGSVSTHNSCSSSTSRRLRSRDAFRRVLQKQQRLQKQQQKQKQSSGSGSGSGNGAPSSAIAEEQEERESTAGVDVAAGGDRDRDRDGRSSPSQQQPQQVPSFLSSPRWSASVAVNNSRTQTASRSRSRSRSMTERTSNKTVNNKPKDDESRSSNHHHHSSSNPTKFAPSPSSSSSAAAAVLPERHVQTIHAAFCDPTAGAAENNKTVDLYSDVLRIDPSATDRDIRIAYFKRGREILGEKGFAAAAAGRKNSGGTTTTTTSGSTTNPSLDEQTQMKFQAISMAYEILSTPGWKEEFEGRILLQRQNHRHQLPPTQTQTQTQTQHLEKSAPFHESTPPPKSTVNIMTADDDDNELELELEHQSRRQTLRQFIAQRRSKPGRMKPSPSSITSTNSSGPDHPKPARPVVPYSTPSLSEEPKVLPSSSSSTSNVSTSAVDRDNDIEPNQEEDEEGPAAAQGNNNKNAVRWKDYVEEVVFDNHPNEHMVSDDEEDDDDDDEDDDEAETMQDDYDYDADDRQFVGNNEEVERSTSMRSTASFNTSDDKSNESSRRSNFSPSKRKKKQRRRVVIDSEELESHLNQMDSEAEQSGHFRADFWDNFEESLDGILSMVDSFGEPVTARQNSARRRGRSTASLASSIESTEKASDVQSLSSPVAPCDGQSNDVIESDSRMRVRDGYSSQKKFDQTQPTVQRASSFPRGNDLSHRHVEVGHVRSYEESPGPAVVSPDVKDGVNASKSSTLYTNSRSKLSIPSKKGTGDDSLAANCHPDNNPSVSSPQSEVTGTDDGSVVSNEDFTLASVTLSESDLPFHEHRPNKSLSRISVERESSGHVRTLKREAVVLEESEDIFSGLEDFQNLDVATIPLRMSGAAVDRGLSAASSISDCLSDISESVFVTSKPEKTVRIMATKRADIARPNIRSDATAATAESAVETNFFDHFTTYVTALLTECETNGVSDSSFQKDLMGLFSTTGGSDETREPRASESVATASVVTEVTESVMSDEC